MLPKFEQFSRERQYLTNVSPATLEWYKHSFKWPPTESPIEDDLKAAVLRMREKGLKATGCNSDHSFGAGPYQSILQTPCRHTLPHPQSDGSSHRVPNTSESTLNV